MKKVYRIINLAILISTILCLTNCGRDCSGIPETPFDSSFILVDKDGHNSVGPGTGIEPKDVYLKSTIGLLKEYRLSRLTISRLNPIDSLTVENYTQFRFESISRPYNAPTEKLNLILGETDTEIVQYVFVSERCYGRKLAYILFNGGKVFDHVFVRI